ncbi:hypothetical protein WKW50_16295 [Ochrobactrum sp. GPK 3]
MMRIVEGGYYKQRNGLIRGPMLIDDEVAIELGAVSSLHPTRWSLDGTNIPRIHTKKNEAVDLVEGMAVFPMPEITDADRFVAHENDGFALEFAGNYNSYTNDDCTLYLFTQSELLRMIKDQRDHLQKSIHVTLPTNSKEDREALFQVLAKEDREALFQVLAKRMSAENSSTIMPAENPLQIINISPRTVYTFAAGLAQNITDSITVHGFENDRDAATVLANQKKMIESAIGERMLNFLNMEGVSTFHDGGVVKGSVEGVAPVILSSEEAIPRERYEQYRSKSREFFEKMGVQFKRIEDEHESSATALESLHLCKPAPTPMPTPGSVWSHKNGNHYAVILISNAESERQDKYPTTVVYQNVENGKVYNRKLSDWHRSMSTVGSDELTESMRKASELLEDFRNKAKTILEKREPKEFIVAAAIYHGGIISLPKPARHHTILQAMDTEMQIGGVINPQQQGFITSTGRYVNRTEAWYIAQAAGQIIRKTSGEDTPNLYSEDLW